jgi:hypothetical protein
MTPQTGHPAKRGACPVIAMVILTPIAMLLLLMALARLEAALLPGGNDGPGSSTRTSQGECGPAAYVQGDTLGSP